MNSFERERLEHAICFFAKAFKEGAKKNLPSMGLYKLLAFMDHWSVKNTGRMAFSLTYKAMKWGPVPQEIYGNVATIKSPLFAFVPKGENRFDVVNKAPPDMEYFSDAEVGEMNRLMGIFADPDMSTSLMSDASHQEITAWEKTFCASPNGIIDFALTFPGNIYKKAEETLTPEEDHYLLFVGLKALHATRNGS